jgi:Na+:H+ antiporter, NhaA family
MSLLIGIGFTMSLFIGTLAFEDSAFGTAIRIGVLGGSVLSAVMGYVVLRRHRARLPLRHKQNYETKKGPVRRCL